MERGRHRLALCCFLAATCLRADVRNAAPVQGGAHYAVPSVAVYALGFFGIFAMLFAFTCPKHTRPILLGAGTIGVLSQYVTIMFDLSKYGDAFSWYDAFLMPAYCVCHPKAYSEMEHVVGLVLPCALMLLSTIVIPVAWTYYARSLARQTPKA